MSEVEHLYARTKANARYYPFVAGKATAAITLAAGIQVECDPGTYADLVLVWLPNGTKDVSGRPIEVPMGQIAKNDLVFL